LDVFLDLFEKGDFVAFSRKFTEQGVSKNTVANKIYEALKPEDKSERFFELDE